MTASARTLVTVPLELVKSRRQEFLDEDNYLPLGVATIFSGRGGEGKSTLALHYVAQVSNGTLPGKYYGQPRNVILISHEDDPGAQVKPRLIAAGANLANITLNYAREHVQDVQTDDVPSLNRDLAIYRQAIEEQEPALVVIDPLTSTIDGDLNKVQDVRRALNPLSQLAQEYDLAVICIMHTRKGQAAASDKTSGSHAFRDVARSVLLFAHDEETGNRVVTVDKSSYSTKANSSFAFRLVDTPVATDDGHTSNVARVELLGTSDVSVPDIWAREHDLGDREEQNDTVQFLRAYLVDAGGSALAGDIRKAAQSNGYVWRTVQRASKKLCEKKSTGYQGQWIWTLKEDESRELSKDDTPDVINDTYATPEGSDTYGATVSPMEDTASALQEVQVF